MITSDFGAPIFELQGKSVVFDRRFQLEVGYFYDFYCGNIYVNPEDVESVVVVKEEQDVDITEEFKSGLYINLNVWGLMYENTEKELGMAGRFVSCDSIEVTFTDEFMKGGKLYGHSVSCMN